MLRLMLMLMLRLMLRLNRADLLFPRVVVSYKGVGPDGSKAINCLFFFTENRVLKKMHLAG